MTIFHSFLLGLIQGASEFLPISSSAHLTIIPWLFGFPDPGLSFDVALHAGTLVAVILYFYRDWINIFEITFLKSKSQIPNLKSQINSNCQLPIANYNQKILYFLILATIPGVLAGYFLESYAETVFRSPLLIALALSAAGFALYLVDKHHVHRKNLQKITWLDSFIIGLSQAAAIIPGISRSGATITAGLALGLNRESAARFSFLLSTPVILGAAVKQFPQLWAAGISYSLLFAVIGASISGWLAIKYLLKFVERSSYVVFFWYRLALAAVILLVYFSR